MLCAKLKSNVSKKILDFGSLNNLAPPAFLHCSTGERRVRGRRGFWSRRCRIKLSKIITVQRWKHLHQMSTKYALIIYICSLSLHLEICSHRKSPWHIYKIILDFIKSQKKCFKNSLSHSPLNVNHRVIYVILIE